jgi:parallel beta-helix repeat protein
VQGVGPTGDIGQNGIEVFGASASLIKNKVSNDTFTGGGNGNQASGILALNSSALSITGNKTSDGTDEAFPLSSLYGEGIVLDSTSNPVIADGNTANGNSYAGIMLLGASNATIEGNSAAHDNVGLYVAGAGSAVTASTDNTVTNNTLDTNQYGVIVDGAYTPKSPGGTGPNPGVASNNTFSTNTWTRQLRPGRRLQRVGGNDATTEPHLGYVGITDRRQL